ncbi:MAG: response regulator [Acidobacteria bacterium]|nr:response regulator [Acidobacteriota bacterium]
MDDIKNLSQFLDSIGESFALIEIIYDGEQNPIDFLHLETNRTFEAHTGMTGAVGRTAHEMAPGLEPFWYETYSRVLRTGESVRIENYSQDLDRWFSVYASRAGRDGENRVALVFTDITERKRAESNIRFLDEFSRRILPINESSKLVQIFGSMVGDFIGASVCPFIDVNEDADEATIFDEWKRPESMSIIGKYVLSEWVNEEFRRTMKSGTPAVIRDVMNDPKVSVKENFTTIDVGAFITVPLIRRGKWLFSLGVYHRKPYDWRDDQVALMQEMTTRIWNKLEQVRAEELARHEKLRLQIALEASKMGVWEWSAVTKRMYWSPESVGLLGIDPNTSFNDYSLLIHPDDRARAIREIRECVANVSDLRLQFRIVKHSGEIINVVSQGHPEKNESGALRRIIGTIRDVTEMVEKEEKLRKNEEKLRQSEKLEAIGRLAGGIAHDFNNMLTVIRGYGQILLSSPVPGDKSRHFLEEIDKAAERAAALTRQLLTFSRSQRLETSVIELNPIIADTTKMLKVLIGENIEFGFDLDPALGRIEADAGQMSQILINLAVNARDAMPDGGNLTFRTRNVEVDGTGELHLKHGKYVLLEVSDTGIGMDEATLANIFEPFFTTKKIGHGTGLGLSTIHGIVEQSGGHIEVQSELCKGSTFAIYFPETVALTNDETATKCAAVCAGRGTVLVVEDEPLVRSFSRDMLAASGFKVLTAENGAQALEKIEKYEIDLILTDIVMPKMSGYELAAELAKRNSRIKMLFTSGYLDDERIRNKSFEFGDNFIRKPFLVEDLVRKIGELLPK